MALSTFCKQCGEHFKLSPVKTRSNSKGFSLGGLFRKKPAESGDASTFLQPSLSSPDRPQKGPALRKDSESKRAESFDVPGEEEKGSSSTRDMSSGEKKSEGAFRSREADPFEGTAPNEPPPSVPFERKKPKANERAVPCIECGTILYVSPHATSTQCRKCSAYLSLQDIEIRNHRRENIKTRGNVTIHKKGSLSASSIACDNLNVYGQISGKIDCAGDAFFQSTGKVVGSIRCKHLKIHKASNLEFIPGIRAETAEVFGKIHGDLICEGTIKISKTGAVVGDCTAPAINMDPGGTLSGQMRIMKPDKAMHDEYTRKAQEAQQEFMENQGPPPSDEEDPEEEDESTDENEASGEAESEQEEKEQDDGKKQDDGPKEPDLFSS